MKVGINVDFIQVLNKLGEDVTPKPLTELLVRKFGPSAQIGDAGSFNQIVSSSSIIVITVLLQTAKFY